MNKIEKLIAKLCPEGVEFKTLGELISLEYGKPLKENRRTGGEFPVLGSNGRVGFHNSYLVKGPCLVVGRKGSAGALVWEENNCYPIDTTFYVKIQNENIHLKYLYYKLKTLELTVKKQDGGVPGLNRNNIYKLKIPIPPLSIQQEIVKILDTFTTLEAELEAELEARKKQYEYYREELLTFGEGVEFKELEDLCVVGDGLHGTPNYNNSGAYYFINGNNLSSGKIAFDSKTKKVDDITFEKYGIPFTIENTVLMSINGTIGSVSLFNKEKIVLGKSVAFFNIKSEHLYSKFLFYFLQTDHAKKYYETQKTGSTINNLGLKALRQFKIPIPPLAEQERIVAILDKFDALVNDISVGLPAELNARRKQYEYYRGKLLTFNPLEKEYAK